MVTLSPLTGVDYQDDLNVPHPDHQGFSFTIPGVFTLSPDDIDDRNFISVFK